MFYSSAMTERRFDKLIKSREFSVRITEAVNAKFASKFVHLDEPVAVAVALFEGLAKEHGEVVTDRNRKSVRNFLGRFFIHLSERGASSFGTGAN